MRCLAWKLGYRSSGAGAVDRVRYVIATGRGIMKIKITQLGNGEFHVTSDFDKGVWEWNEYSALPTGANRFWEHRFIDELERLEKIKGVEKDDLTEGRKLHLHKLNQDESLDLLLDDEVPGGEEAWANYMRLTGLDQDEEIGSIIRSDHEERELERVHGAYSADNSYGMF